MLLRNVSDESTLIGNKLKFSFECLIFVFKSCLSFLFCACLWSVFLQLSVLYLFPAVSCLVLSSQSDSCISFWLQLALCVTQSNL